METLSNKYPYEALPLDMTVEISTDKPLGLTAKVLVQERARKLALYNEAIECDMEGESTDGKKIAVNNVGRWLFGVPGYTGHIRIVADENKITLYYPKESSKAVHNLIFALKTEMQK